MMHSLRRYTTGRFDSSNCLGLLLMTSVSAPQLGHVIIPFSLPIEFFFTSTVSVRPGFEDSPNEEPGEDNAKDQECPHHCCSFLKGTRSRNSTLGTRECECGSSGRQRTSSECRTVSHRLYQRNGEFQWQSRCHTLHKPCG